MTTQVPIPAPPGWSAYHEDGDVWVIYPDGQLGVIAPGFPMPWEGKGDPTGEGKTWEFAPMVVWGRSFWFIVGGIAAAYVIFGRK